MHPVPITRAPLPGPLLTAPLPLRGLPPTQPHPTRPSFHRLCWVPNLVYHRATGTLSILHSRHVFTVKILVFRTRPPSLRLHSRLRVGSFYANGFAPGSQAPGLGRQPGVPRDFSEEPHTQRDPTELWSLPSAAPEASRLVHGTHTLSCSGRSSRRHPGLLLPVRPSRCNVHYVSAARTLSRQRGGVACSPPPWPRILPWPSGGSVHLSGGMRGSDLLFPAPPATSSPSPRGNLQSSLLPGPCSTVLMANVTQ